MQGDGNVERECSWYEVLRVLPFIYVWKTVIAFCVQVVKTLVSQGYARSDRYGVDWFSASRGLVCYRRAGISVFDNLEFAWFQRCFFGSKFWSADVGKLMFGELGQGFAGFIYGGEEGCWLLFSGREDSCFSRICKARSLQCGSVPASRCLNWLFVILICCGVCGESFSGVNIVVIVNL